MNGNSQPDMEYFLSNRIYDVSDFVQISHLRLYCRRGIEYNPKRLNCKKDSDNSINNKIINDLNRLELPVFLAEYACLGIVEQTKLDYNEDGYCLIPDTFMKVLIELFGLISMHVSASLKMEKVGVKDCLLMPVLSGRLSQT